MEENKITNDTEQHQAPHLRVGAVMCSSFQEIIDMLNRGVSIFPKGYLRTLGEMNRAGLIECELYKDGSCAVRLNCT